MLKHAAETELTASGLLEQYCAGSSFFLSTSERTLLGQGEYARLITLEKEGGSESLPGRVTELLKAARLSGQAAPVIVGAVPFDPAKAAALVIPESVLWAGPLKLEAQVREENALQASSIREIPGREGYEEGVRKALALIEEGELRKVVLSRTLRIDSAAPVDLKQLLRKLARQNTRGYTFAVSLPGGADLESGASSEGGATAGNPKTLLGASPELLVTKTGFRIRANPLAGSAARSDDPVDDRRRAEALLVSPKDRHEHAVVVEAVAAALRPYCKHLEVPSVPSLVQTKTMWHLSSELTGELEDSTVSSLELALALHPTPAVCGAPMEAAREAIGQIEPFDRGFFTGMIGWCDMQGDGEWVVTIRCAEVQGSTLCLYAGAGIVAGSSPEAEYAETSAKLGTFLLALGLEHGQPAPAGEGR
jgi:isochorismate synthase